MHNCLPGHAYTFDYTNYKGSRARRHVIFREVSWGSNDWYPELQFFFTGFDVDKNEVRSFSFSKIEINSFSRFTDQQLHNHLNPPPEDEPASAPIHVELPQLAPEGDL